MCVPSESVELSNPRGRAYKVFASTVDQMTQDKDKRTWTCHVMLDTDGRVVECAKCPTVLS